MTSKPKKEAFKKTLEDRQKHLVEDVNSGKMPLTLLVKNYVLTQNTLNVTKKHEKEQKTKIEELEKKLAQLISDDSKLPKKRSKTVAESPF